MASPTPTPIRIAQTTALLLSGITTGVSLSLSALVIPRLLESPVPLMLKQWLHTLQLGKRTVPFAGLLSAASYVYLALGHKSSLSTAQTRAYLAAAVLSVSIAPYTKLVMRRTNGRLMELAEKAEREGTVSAIVSTAAAAAVEAADDAGKGEGVVEVEAVRSIKGLVDHWGVLNLGRTALLLAGTMCGFVATI
ncbi:hypothetical protein VTJ04DRAFT_1621 [Mycothermus thermophilus]|uniref:uncharacterized protein n=1 Tax=Humicola insolens TaxID=85995 RepID=UPI00374480D4